MQIVAKDLTYTYSPKAKELSFKALCGVSLTVNEGEIFGIVGKTGSGKTTFIQHLNGLIRVQKDGGALSVGEFDLTDKKCDLKGLRSKLGMVFQYPEYQLFAETVKDDVMFGLKNFNKDLTDEQKEQLIKEAICLVGLDYEKIKDKSPFELSGGQKRRVAIAGVIVSKPEILVLDEPVAGLDPQGKTEFLALLHSLKDKFVKTLIIITHDMNVVSEHCHRVAVFSGGKIIKVGTPKEVFADKEVLCDLELPLTAFLQEQLTKVGLNIDCDLTVDGFVEAYISALNDSKKEGE